jgi:effector-binding domain-containing protein
MTHEVTLELVDARPTAVVRETTTWTEFPTVWPPLLGEVWSCLHAGGIVDGCPNVMVYTDSGDQVDVEIGVELRRPCPLTGRVEASVLPAGRVATTVHRGPYSQLGLAHEAISVWCEKNGHDPTGTRWEIYGPHVDDPTLLVTEVYWQVQP